MNWPPNYKSECIARQDRINAMTSDKSLMYGAKEYYKDKPKEFLEHWGITYDPRNAQKGIPTIMPFILFERQMELVDFIMECVEDEEAGLLEKTRDMGATWICCGLSVFIGLFWAGSAVGWGSRKEQLVDKIGDPDSIFEKMRMFITYLPGFLLPQGFNLRKHSSYMKLINPENDATITGEAGDNIGRGGRKLIYFKDESAHYERPERIEAALGDNTRVQIDLSSVNGTANVFARKRQSGEVWYPGKEMPKGKVRVFIMDWRDHPAKTQEWYERRKEKAEMEGLYHIFAQEVDRDYSASLEGIIIPAKWVKAAVDLHEHIDKDLESGRLIAGLDVADEGGDLNALGIRKGITLVNLDKWAQGDTSYTADNAVFTCRQFRVSELHYDSIGVGSGIKGECNRLKRENEFPEHLHVFPWNAGAKVLDPEQHVIKNDRESPKNKDVFRNLKAQSWWRLRIRFEKTWKFVTKGIVYPVDELINIRSDVPYFHELIQELSQPTYGFNTSGKMVVNKKPDGTRSPNLGDAVNIAFNPYVKMKQLVW